MIRELPMAAAGEAGFSQAGLQRLSRVMQREIDSGHVPGAVMLLARGGKVAHFESLGRQAPDAAAPMARDSLFRIYSMTKPIVSLAILMLMEEGQLLLIDPVWRYLPEFKDIPRGIEQNGRLELVKTRRAATLQDLLRHTAGFTYEFLGMGLIRQRYAEARMASRERSNREFARELAAIPLLHEPGSAWEYSRATDVLGAIIEVISGLSLGAFLQERIVGPLGMKDTGFSVPAAQQDRLAQPFAVDPDSGAAVSLIEVRTPPRFESGGGGLVSTAMDYARFLQMMRNGGELDGVRLVGRKTIEYMTADHLGGIPVLGDLLPPGHGFGLGFAVRSGAGVAPIAGSAGLYYWGGIAGTTFFVDPKEDLYALMMIQAPGQKDHFRALFRNLVYAALAD